MLDAVGPEGMYLSVWAPDERTAEKLVENVAQYR